MNMVNFSQYASENTKQQQHGLHSNGMNDLLSRQKVKNKYFS